MDNKTENIILQQACTIAYLKEALAHCHDEIIDHLNHGMKCGQCSIAADIAVEALSKSQSHFEKQFENLNKYYKNALLTIQELERKVDTLTKVKKYYDQEME